MLYLAELGKPQKLGVFAVFNNSTDVSESCAGVASQFEWTWGKEEIALYDSEHSMALLCLHGPTMLSMSCKSAHTLHEMRLRASLASRS